MLTKNQLYNLRKQVTINSVMLKDYSNNMFISEKTACNFFDSYIEYLYELARDDNYYGDFTFAGHDKYQGCTFEGNVTVIPK